jgi:predicted ATP-dependent protease
MKAEIIAKIIALNNQPSVLNSTDEFNELVNEFYQIQNEEERLFEIEKLDRMAAGEKPENIERPVYEHLEEFKAVCNVFKERKKVELTQIKDQETANYKQKKVYLAALTDLDSK